jgi:hypothetical protein
VLLAMHLSSHQVLARLLKLDPAWTLEETWEQGKRTWGGQDTLGMTPEETALGSALSKLALNVCLRATAYCVRCLGPDNPSHFERLKRYANPQPHLGRCAGASRAEVGVADLLAAGAFGPGLPQSTPSRHTPGPGLAPVTHRANSRIAKRCLGYRHPAGSTRQATTTVPQRIVTVHGPG